VDSILTIGMTLIPVIQDMFMIAKKNKRLVSVRMMEKIDVNFMLDT
jgi:hypothetical protein